MELLSPMWWDWGKALGSEYVVSQKDGSPDKLRNSGANGSRSDYSEGIPRSPKDSGRRTGRCRSIRELVGDEVGVRSHFD